MSKCHKTKRFAKCTKTVLKQSLKQKIREFATFLTGVEGWFALSYMVCLEKVKIGRVVFVYNVLDFDAFIAFVLA